MRRLDERSLVMSMWKVPDWATNEQMIQFYKNIQSGKMSRCRALRQTVLKEMKIVRRRYGQPNPLFWGALVFLSEP
jgi:CHAT domain-containing protein